MSVPFLDLGAATRELSGEIQTAVARVVSSGWYIGGGEVTAFEEAFAAYCEADHCVGVGNGLDALVLSLRAVGVGPGAEVIVPSNTYIATWLAVSAVGAVPVPVEPDEATHTLDPGRVEAAVTERTRALLPVHLYGHPADLDPLLALARRRGLKVIEDAAQAHGARYRGRRIGSHSDAVCWSFYPGKNLGALGDGGAVTTNNAAVAERVRILGNYGSRQKYVNLEKGVNSRLDPLQAAVLSVKLARLDEWNERRRQVAARYGEALAGSGLTLPASADWAEPVWHLYVVRTVERDALQARLTKAGIGTLIHYPIPPHRQDAYADLAPSLPALPLAERLAAEVMSLPIGPQLSSRQVSSVSVAMSDRPVL